MENGSHKNKVKLIKLFAWNFTENSLFT